MSEGRIAPYSDRFCKSNLFFDYFVNYKLNFFFFFDADHILIPLRACQLQADAKYGGPVSTNRPAAIMLSLN